MLLALTETANAASARAPAPIGRKLWKAWLAILASFLGIAAVPVSNTLTRYGSIVTLLTGWGLLTAINWRRRCLRVPLLLIPAICAVFLVIGAE